MRSVLILRSREQESSVIVGFLAYHLAISACQLYRLIQFPSEAFLGAAALLVHVCLSGAFSALVFSAPVGVNPPPVGVNSSTPIHQSDDPCVVPLDYLRPLAASQSATSASQPLVALSAVQVTLKP